MSNNKVKWWNWDFIVYEHSGNWLEVAGIYIFAGLNLRGEWEALYIGSTESLAERLPNHEMWPEAVRLGATHTHARVESQVASRLAIEKILIQNYQHRLNIQHR